MCLDSTHGTCVGYDRERCFLYTLVARSDTTGKGAPFCWMITNSEAHQPVEHWLKWLHENHGFRPVKMMIDNSDTEILAIRKALGDSCQILLCHWHILRAWKKQIASKVTSTPDVQKTIDEKKMRRNEGFEAMIAMMKAETIDDFNYSYEDFELWCQVEDGWDGTELLDYFDREYLVKKESWANAWRHVSIIFISNLRNLQKLCFLILYI